MKRIVSKRTLWGLAKEATEVKYISIDGLTFYSENSCIRHEDNISRKKRYYEKCLSAGIYTIEKLREIYADYERHRDAWMRSTQQDWLSYCAGQYALKLILGIK